MCSLLHDVKKKGQKDNIIRQKHCETEYARSTLWNHPYMNKGTSQKKRRTVDYHRKPIVCWKMSSNRNKYVDKEF